MSQATGWQTHLEIDASVFLATGAVVTGSVRIGPRASVWFHTVIRGDTDRIEVGEETNLQDLSVVHVDEGQPALIGSRVTVGHRAVVHGCVIEDECLIGMGSIVLSGAHIGTGSLVGAGALVREGQQIPPGSLVVGAPARVLGPVQESHRAAIRDGNRHYVALSREYLARGFGQPIPAADHALGVRGLPPAAMTHLEWGQRLAALAEAPGWAASLLEVSGEARWTRRPGPDRWSAHEVVAHLLESDAHVFGPRLERLLREERPELPEVDLIAIRASAGTPGLAPRAQIERWRESRRTALERLAPLRSTEWARRGVHSRRGPYSVADAVRSWVEHEASHRRQIERALAASR